MLSAIDMPSRWRAPTASATAWNMSTSSLAVASSQNHTPSGNRGSNSAATCNANRVLPTPPAPVSVTSDNRQTSSVTDAISASRPTNDVTCSGRLSRGNASSVRSGGNSRPRSGWVTWNNRSGRPRSRSRCSPRSTNPYFSGSASCEQLFRRG